jgi:adenylate cyclase
LRELDLVRVKGRETPEGVYELLGRSGTTLPELKEQSLICYEAGLKAYRQQRWDEAIENFEEGQAFCPEDKSFKTMTDRSKLYKTMPPLKDWDGTFRERRK